MPLIITLMVGILSVSVHVSKTAKELYGERCKICTPGTSGQNVRLKQGNNPVTVVRL